MIVKLYPNLKCQYENAKSHFIVRDDVEISNYYLLEAKCSKCCFWLKFFYSQDLESYSKYDISFYCSDKIKLSDLYKIYSTSENKNLTVLYKYNKPEYFWKEVCRVDFYYDLITPTNIIEPGIKLINKLINMKSLL